MEIYSERKIHFNEKTATFKTVSFFKTTPTLPERAINNKVSNKNSIPTQFKNRSEKKLNRALAVH